MAWSSSTHKCLWSQSVSQHLAGERETLTGVLEFHRETLARKCSGLTADQLRLRAVEPSALSLLGLVRHLTDVELGWFARIMSGADTPFAYWQADTPDGSDVDVDDADVDESLRLWHSACARSREIVAACDSLDTVGVYQRTGNRYSLRWILTHMIQEYARHNGHADLIRERIDGQTGT
ncbi:DinB family protein [Nocardia arthritidis]|uniref:DinB family protein n=1 Tax=Nocardia arthritidis TaxID=228602 RepID=UPI001EEB766C|nr:DinB family protein [Nocardia arthritidis]